MVTGGQRCHIEGRVSGQPQVLAPVAAGRDLTPMPSIDTYRLPHLVRLLGVVLFPAVLPAQ
jgi:hypothetical protein